MTKRQSSLQDFYSKRRLLEAKENEESGSVINTTPSVDSESYDLDLSLVSNLIST